VSVALPPKKIPMVPGVYEGSSDALLLNSKGDKQFRRELVKPSCSVDLIQKIIIKPIDI